MKINEQTHDGNKLQTERPNTPHSITQTPINTINHSPRVLFLQEAADRTILEDPQISAVSSKWQRFAPPLPLLMQTFQGLTTKNETFWFKVSRYFKREQIPVGTVLYNSGTEPTAFYIIES